MIPAAVKHLGRSVSRVGWWSLIALAATSLGGLCGLMVAWFSVDLPDEMLQPTPGSPVVVDADGHALMTLVGPDDHWRIDVPITKVSPWLIRAVMAIEDQRFFYHEGVDPVAVVRAVGQNALLGHRFSGASTITMQVCRLLEPNDRTWSTKIVESIRAMKLEQRLGKRRILQTWMNLAPMGGNIRGVEAASWFYLGKSAWQLSLAEAALLAGLPQSPTRYRPDRHLDRARGRQRQVLAQMLDLGWITPQQHQAALDQPIEIRRRAYIVAAPHAAWLAMSRRAQGGKLCLDIAVQSIAADAVQQKLAELPEGTQGAAVIIDIESAGLVGLVGSRDYDDSQTGQVNFAAAWRSPGSTLKPFVYAAAMEAGRLSPDSTLYDVPISRGNWQPENFDGIFRGAVRADDALRDSLNIPAILVAEAIGIERAVGLMQACGVRFRTDAAKRGWLATVTGAVEVRLLDLTNAYAAMGRGGRQRSLRLFADAKGPSCQAMAPNVAATINHVLSLGQRTNQSNSASGWCMWKTGTSSGRRDAWAVGHNGRYAIGVWVGSASGPGRDEYVGASAAEPIFLAIARHPYLAAAEVPQPPQPIVVRRPIGPPADTGAGPLRILRPAPQTRFVAVGGKSIVHPAANHSEPVQWFLNGKLIGPSQASRLSLSVGQYRLRIVDARGNSASVQFSVE